MDLHFLIFSLVKSVLVLTLLHTIAGYAVLAERKISAWIQDRVGPNRVAPPFMKYVPVLGPMLTRWGVFQPLADGLKFMLKEDFTPAGVRKMYFWLAPALAVIPSLLVIPVLLIAGNLNLSQIISWQVHHGWLFIYAPVSLVIFLVASFAETNRTP